MLLHEEKVALTVLLNFQVFKRQLFSACREILLSQINYAVVDQGRESQAIQTVTETTVRSREGLVVK